MKVKELIEKLSQCDPNEDVSFWGYNYYEQRAYIGTVRIYKDGTVLLEE